MKDGVRARYTLEFKQQAVRLVRGGEKLSAVARTLGVSVQSLDNWVKAEASGRHCQTCGPASKARPGPFRPQVIGVQQLSQIDWGL